MSSLKWLKILNPIIAIAFLTAAVAVTLYKYPLIPSLNGIETVYEIHETAGLIFILLGILHIILNWNWIKSQIFGIKPVRKTKPTK